MKNNQNGEFNIKVEGELQATIEAQNQSSSNIQSPKSGGSAPSDLGAIKKNSLSGSESNSMSRSNVSKPSSGSNASSSNGYSHSKPRQQNKAKDLKNITSNNINKKDKTPNNKGQVQKKGVANPKDKNPALNQNRMKDFAKNKKVTDPKINSSASFLGKGRGMFNGKMKLPKLPGLNGISASMFSKKKATDGVTKLIQKKSGAALMTVFKALPIQVKIAIIGGGLIFFLIMVVIILLIVTNTSASDGNREMKDDFIKGDFTEEQLCEYLEQNHYLDDDEVECKEHPAYKFFMNFKEIKEEYETKYERYRFRVNVELLYETLAYYNADEEFYDEVTKEEIRDLMDAMIEEIEESCVIKEYDKKNKVCAKKTKYVYTLYEFSLDKFISYLRYGTTSTHPNYGNDPDNKSTNKKSVTRICGEGKNVDYVFGYGLVNTSSSPLSESSDCPGEPVTKEDYETLPDTKTTLEALGAYGGVSYYDTVYEGEEIPDTGENGKSDKNTTKNVVISPSHQIGNEYTLTGTKLSEKASMYALSVYLKNALELRGYNVYVVPENLGKNNGNGGYDSIHTDKGVKWLNGATGIYIALHSNAGGGHGPQVLYEPSSSNSKTFAEKLCTSMKKHYSETISGLPEGTKTVVCEQETGPDRTEVTNFYKEGSGAAALAEVGYHDNEAEAKWIINNYAGIASALANAIDDYIG